MENSASFLMRPGCGAGLLRPGLKGLGSRSELFGPVVQVRGLGREPFGLGLQP
ncbi:hypothetical protein ACN24M_00655 [Streptomyces microflavus]